MKTSITKLAAFALILTVVSIPPAATAQVPYTITFDEFPESHFGSQIDEEYADLGIHFTTAPPTDPPITFHSSTVYTADTWPTTPFSFLPIPPGQFLAFHKPQGQAAVTGVGMTFDYYCSQIGFRYRRPGGNATSRTIFYVQLFDTERGGEPIYLTQLEAIVKPPEGSDAEGYLSFSLTAPDPFNMVVLSASKKFQIEDLTITPGTSSGEPTLDNPWPEQAGNVVAAGQNLVVDAASVGTAFVWSGTKPDGSPLSLWDPDNPSDAGGIGRDTGLFVAPSEGNFAGTYEITVEHEGTGLTRGYTVVVPVQVEADNKVIFVAGDPKKSFHAYGTESIASWEFFPTLSRVPGMMEVKSDGGHTNNKLEFTPADTLTDAVVFRLKAVAAVDGTQECVGYSPKIYVLPVATLSGRLADPDAPGKDWTTASAKATLLKASGEPTVDVDADGSFSFNVPKTTGLGLTYAVTVTADGYLTRTVTGLSPGQTYGVTMEPRTGSISGNIKSGGANLENATVVAYKEVTVDGEVKKYFSDPSTTGADGNYTINLEPDPTDNTIDGNYTVIAAKNGYQKETAAGIIVQEFGGLKDVDAADYAALSMGLTKKTRLIITRKEWDHDSNSLTPMVTDLSFTAQQTAFTDVADLTGPTLVPLTVDGTSTTNLGSLGALSLDGTTITCRYTPNSLDSLIGIRVQAHAGQTYKSDEIDYTFLVHPASTTGTCLTRIEPVDTYGGATVGDATETALVGIPFNGLTGSSAASVFIEKVNSTDSTIEGSDVVEIVILDGSGNDLGNIVNSDNPLEITMAFNPATFDPAGFTVYYRNKQSGGSWGSWVDGVQDGSITLFSIDLANNTVTFKVTHLTSFGLGTSGTGTGSGSSGQTSSGTVSIGSSASGSLSPLGGDGVGGAGCFISTIAE